MSEWISVEKRLPEEMEEVLVYLDRSYKRGRRIAFSCIYDGKWNHINGSVWPDMPKPTHWQPIPEPPKP